MPTVDLVLKSYPSDYQWLSYCLRSIEKYCTGFNNVIVMLPRAHPLPLTKETVVLLDTPESYLAQQVCKLNADYHTQADFCVHCDSDTVFTRPVTPEYFFKDGKPIWVVTPFTDATDNEQNAWLHVMVKCLRQMPPYEFMRRDKITIPRWLYAKFRQFIEMTHHVTMEQYVMNQPGREFSEYNCIGFFAWLNFRDSFHWHNTATDGVPDWPFKHYWSYGGLTPEIKAELEEITK